MVVLAGGNPYSQYREQSAATASPGELTLMLYDGCVKNLKLSKLYIGERDYAKANDTSKKAQAIVDELIKTLDLRYDVASQMLSLYDFVLRTIVEGNVQKDAAKIDTAIEFISELRDTWHQAVRLNRQKVMVSGGHI
ncbi:MAG: flagellar export chaperone FliS [Oscillospiraceae bacterium]|jgi:flagellar protein FliS|nr:flagellar export chaperone FliS [Oscillospiraceae bacterium]